MKILKTDQYKKLSLRQKKLEDALWESEEKFKILSETSPDGIMSTDRLGFLTYINPALEKIFGYPSKESLGTHFSKYVTKESKLLAIKLFRGLKKNRAVRKVRLEVVHKDKHIFPIEVSASPILKRGKFVGIECIIRDITDQVRLEQQKDEFIAIASHELKTPLTSLKAYTQIAYKKLEKTGESATLNLIKRVDEQSEKLISIVSDLLDITRIHSGKLLLDKENFSLNDLVNEIVSDFLSSEELNLGHFIIIKGGIKKNIYADRFRIGQVLINLIYNAAKYSPGGSKIIINLNEKGGETIVSVKDYGIGIATPAQKRIFEKFYRENPAKNKGGKLSDLGLGLFISEEIINRHSGRIWFKSRKNKGSTFYFALPSSKVF